MAQQVTLAGAHIKVYMAGNWITSVQGVSYSIDYGEEEIYGIDSSFPQEIASTRVRVSGSMEMVYILGDGGIEEKDIRSKITEILQAPYIAVRISERKTNNDIIFIPQSKVTQQSFSVNAKGVAKITLGFKGIIPRLPIDLK